MKNKILNIIGIALVASFTSAQAAESVSENEVNSSPGLAVANILDSAETSYGYPYGRGGGYGYPYRRGGGYPYRRGGGYRRCY